jgi:hypothetical protein
MRRREFIMLLGCRRRPMRSMLIVVTEAPPTSATSRR